LHRNFILEKKVMIERQRHGHFRIFQKIIDFADFSFLRQTNLKLNWIQIFPRLSLQISIFLQLLVLPKFEFADFNVLADFVLSLKFDGF